jgi:short-subunit dehydrogenase
MTKIKDKNVLITGGASGIGKIMGRMALEKGASSLMIWDINPQNISTAVKELSLYGKVKGYIVDVSKNELVTEGYNKIVNEYGPVDILINCAGIVTGNKTFDQMSPEEMVRTMNINTLAPMFVTRVMLPDMISRNRGHICNIASAGGMLSNPKMSVYAASKWAAIGWSDSVRIELQEMKSSVHVTTVAPYYINTGMFNGVKSRIIPILKPEYVAKRIIRAIERNKSFRGIPFGFHFIRFWQFLLPTRLFDWFFGELMGIYHAMDDFKGRKTVSKAPGKAS